MTILCSSFIAVSPALCRLVSDRRLSAVANRVYRPQPQLSPSTVLVALLLLLGGIELNPGRIFVFATVSDDYSPEAVLTHINELKFSLYGGAACYQPSRLAEQSLNSMQLQHQQQQPVEKLLLLLKQ